MSAFTPPAEDSFINETFQKYDINEKTGFLPSLSQQEAFLNDDVFKIASSLDIKNIALTRKGIESISVITDGCTIVEYRRLYGALTAIQSFWIWCEGEANPQKMVPYKIYSSLEKVCKKLGTRECLTLYSCACCNYQVKEGIFEKMIQHPNNVSLLYPITGSETERYFFAVMACIEAVGTSIIKNAVKYIHVIKNNDQVSDHQIEDILHSINETVSEITRLTMSVVNEMDPNVFYGELRPFLSGTSNKDIFPDGIHTVDDSLAVINIEPLDGGSSAQSSLIPVIDFMLGINHDNCDFMKRVRNYMPSKHVDFLSWLETHQKPIDFINSDSELYPDSHQAFMKCRKTMIRFRKSHMGLVHKFITIPSKMLESKLSVNGTGGSDISSIVKQVENNDETSNNSAPGYVSLLQQTLQNTRTIITTIEESNYRGWSA